MDELIAVLLLPNLRYIWLAMAIVLLVVVVEVLLRRRP